MFSCEIDRVEQISEYKYFLYSGDVKNGYCDISKSIFIKPMYHRVEIKKLSGGPVLCLYSDDTHCDIAPYDRYHHFPVISNCEITYEAKAKNDRDGLRYLVCRECDDNLKILFMFISNPSSYDQKHEFEIYGPISYCKEVPNKYHGVDDNLVVKNSTGQTGIYHLGQRELLIPMQHKEIIVYRTSKGPIYIFFCLEDDGKYTVKFSEQIPNLSIEVEGKKFKNVNCDGCYLLLNDGENAYLYSTRSRKLIYTFSSKVIFTSKRDSSDEYYEFREFYDNGRWFAFGPNGDLEEVFGTPQYGCILNLSRGRVSVFGDTKELLRREVRLQICIDTRTKLSEEVKTNSVRKRVKLRKVFDNKRYVKNG